MRITIALYDVDDDQIKIQTETKFTRSKLVEAIDVGYLTKLEYVSCYDVRVSHKWSCRITFHWNKWKIATGDGK